MNINLNDSRKKELVAEVQTYFRNEHEQDFGDLKAEMIVDFFIQKLGPQIYNQAIDDANSFIQEKLIDLEGVLYIPE